MMINIIRKYNICRLSGLFMAVLLCVVTNQAIASIAVDDNKQLSLLGDVRLRIERDDRTKSDTAKTEEDRNRFRVRARLGAKYKANDQWMAKMRLSTQSTSLNSPHTTLGTSDTGKNGSFGLDRASVVYQPISMLKFEGGKMGMPIWQQNEVFWDTDISPEGIALTSKLGPVSLRGLWWMVTEGSWNSDISGYMAQAVYSQKLGGLKLTAAVTGAGMDNNTDTDGDYVDDIALQSDRHVMGSFQVKGSSWRVGAEYIKSNADDEDKAYVAQFRYQIIKPLGIRAYYYHVEAFSVLGDGIFSQDNFPNPNNSGVSNFEGGRLQLDYKAAKNTNIDLRYYYMVRIKEKALLAPSMMGAWNQDAIFGDRRRTRIQLNINVKF